MADGVTAPIDFEARFTKAVENLEDFMGRVDKRTKGGARSMLLLENAAKTFIAAFSVKKVIDGLQALVDKATEAEEATFKLGQALKATGSNTGNNIRRFQELAKELERTSRYEDDLILSQVAIAKQFGVTNREAEQLIRVAVDLSAATGEDLATSVRNLGQTLDGTAGKMAQQFPILQQLTAAQLRNGAAVKLLGDLYRGSASRSVDTFKGQQTQLTKALGNVAEAFGMIITQSPKVIGYMASLTKALQDLTEWIERNGSRISDFIGKAATAYKAFVGVVTRNRTLLKSAFDDIAGEKASSSVDLFNGKMDNLLSKFNPITGKFERLASSAAKSSVEMAKSGESFDYVTGKFSKGFDESRLSFDRFANEIKDKIEGLQKQLEDIGKTELDTLTNLYNRNRDLINKAADKSFVTRKSQTDLLGRLELDYVRKRGELMKKQYSELEAQVRDAYDNPARTFLGGNQYDTGSVSPGNQQAIGAAAGAGREVLRGREGARNLLSSTVGAIAQAWLGPAGKIFGEIINELSKGKEYTRQMVSEFLTSMPELIGNIVDGLQEAFIAFGENLPEFADKIIDRVPDIIENFIKNLPKLFTAFIVGVNVALARLVGAFYKAVGRFFTELVRGAGRFISEVVKGAGRFIGELVKGAGRFIDELVSGINKKLGKSGGGGGLGLGNLAGGIGGVVGGAAGAIINPIGSGITRGISSLFKGEQGGGVPTQVLEIQLQVGQNQFAKAIVDLKRLGYRLEPS